MDTIHHSACMYAVCHIARYFIVLSGLTTPHAFRSAAYTNSVVALLGRYTIPRSQAGTLGQTRVCILLLVV